MKEMVFQRKVETRDALLRRILGVTVHIRAIVTKYASYTQPKRVLAQRVVI